MRIRRRCDDAVQASPRSTMSRIHILREDFTAFVKRISMKIDLYERDAWRTGWSYGLVVGPLCCAVGKNLSG